MSYSLRFCISCLTSCDSFLSFRISSRIDIVCSLTGWFVEEGDEFDSRSTDRVEVMALGVLSVQKQSHIIIERLL